MIYLSNDPYPQEISIPRSFGVIVPQRKVYLTEDDIAANLETDSDRKVLAASQGVALKRLVDDKADADNVYTKSQVDDALAEKQDTLTPGDNIRIENNVISADVPEVDAYTKQETDELLSQKADKSDTYTKEQVDTALAGKQDTINDLQTIREGAAAGATAYQKPQSGIPASDLADGVIPTIPVEDVKVGGASVVTDKIAEIPAIPDAVEANPTIPAGVTPVDLQNLKVGDDFFSIQAEPEIFWATYGVTTASQIDQAVADGKFVACIYNGNLYCYSGKDATYHYFTRVYSGVQVSQLRIVISSGSWTTQTSGIQVVSSRVNTIDNTATNTQYPSAKAVFDSLGKWGVVSQTQTWTGGQSTGWSYTMSNLVWGLIPQAAIDLYENSGAVFNVTTGYFELNGLTDLSYEEIRLAYKFAYNTNGKWTTLFGDTDLKNARTTFPLSIGSMSNSSFNRSFTYDLFYFTTMSNMEVLRLTQIPDRQIVLSPYSGFLFYSGRNPLRKVIGSLNLYNCNAAAWMVNYCFTAAYDLEEIHLQEIRGSIKFHTNTKLTLESIVYAVAHSANGATAITITLHPTAYARCQADTTEYTYNGQTYTGIIAYAAAKNITIASA